MKIYLPLKNDVLDHGDANSVWTNPYVSGGGLPLFKSIGGVRCAEFSTDYIHNSRINKLVLVLSI